MPRSGEDKLWLQTDATKLNVSCRRIDPAELSPDVETEFTQMSVTSVYDKEDGRIISEGEDFGFTRRAAAVP
jgi:hypothetical protein